MLYRTNPASLFCQTAHARQRIYNLTDGTIVTDRLATSRWSGGSDVYFSVVAREDRIKIWSLTSFVSLNLSRLN